MRRQFSIINLALLVLLLLGASACGGVAEKPVALSSTHAAAPTASTAPADSSGPPAPSLDLMPSRSSGESSASDVPGAVAAEGAAGANPSSNVGASGSAGTGAATGDKAHAPAEDYSSARPADTPAAASSSTGGTTVTYGNAQPAPAQQPMTAGKVDDNADFNDYLGYIGSYQGLEVHPMAVAQRLFLKVVDHDQHPVAGARVQLSVGQRQVFSGTTMSDGTVLFFPEAAGVGQVHEFRATVSRGQAKAEVQNVTVEGPATEVPLRDLTDNTGPVNLDLVFLLDATGSMGDEIDRIKETVGTIASRIEQLPGSAKPRFGLVAFRDRGDDFVTRSWDFTGDIKQFSQNLANVEAAGGGDEPESVNAGLHEAIHLPGWADNSTGRHLRMIVLVGDAPPHLHYPNDYEYTDLLKVAVEEGIKIFPIGASGLDDQGEYIFRQFAQFTQGQFVFLTYANGVSGAPGVATDHHVSNFTVTDLDSLVVNLVAGEIANQTGNKLGDSSVPVVSKVSIVPIKGPTPAPGFFPALVQVVRSVLSDAAGWLLLMWLPALLLVGWLRRRYSTDLQARALPSVDFELSPAPTTELSSADLPEAARVAAVETPSLYSPTLPVDLPVYLAKDVQPALGQSTVALANLPADVEAATW